MTSRFVKICVLLLCSFFAVATFAQNANSSIQGTVEDTHGAVIPGATVTLTNVGTNQALTKTSKANGFYTFTNLAPANYNVTVSSAGFANWVGVLTLRVSQAAQVNPRMTAASVTTQVVVKDVTPVIDQVNGMMSDVKEATRIETIPLQNRNVLNILNFTPGVVANGFAGQGAGWTRINGMPGGSLDYLIDGQTAEERYTGELEENPQPIPTFQEIKVITSNGNAQYSRPGIVEMVTKSGTNHFHGQLFELNQNNVLRAKTYRQTNINYLNHNEFGGQIGGPVLLPKLYNGRNKTFFFVDLEGIRTDSFAQALDKIPTAQWQTGDLSTLVDTLGAPITIYDPLTTRLDPVTGAYTRTQISYNGAANVIPPNRINPVSAKVMSYMPHPNINVPYYDTNYSVPAASDTLRNKLYTAKVDQLFGPNRLAIRYTYTSSNTLSPIGSGYLLTNGLTAQGGHNGAVVFTQVLGPRAVNIVRAGVNYSHNFNGPQLDPTIESTLGLPTYAGTQSWPEIDWFGGFALIDSDNPKDYPGSTITASDQFSYNRGNHQLMFGFNLQNYRVNTYNYVAPGGAYYFNGNFSALQNPADVTKGIYDEPTPDTGSGFADLLMGNMDEDRVSVFPHFHSQQTEYAGFAQDDWRVSQRLTLNLGVRYTYWTAFKDAKGIGSNFDPSIPGGMVVYQGSGALPAQTSQAVETAFVNAGLPIESATAAGYPGSLWNMPKNNWDPRFGFAYQLDSKSVLRGGWGMYHWAMPLDFWLNVSHANPPFSYKEEDTADIDGDPAAAQLEFPIASTNYGGPLPADEFQWGETVNGVTPGPTVLNTNVLLISSTGGWSIMPLDPNYKAQMVQEYNLSFARELPGHFGAQISYVGNRSRNLPMEDPYNYTIPRLEAPTGATVPERRAFPNFATSSYNTMAALKYIGYSNDNQLNAELTRNFGGGLTVQAAYIWSRTLSTSAINEGSYVPQAANIEPASLTPGYTVSNYLSGASQSERLRVDYGPDSQVPFHTLNINGHYEFPFGRGKRFLSNSSGLVNRLVSGYNISPFFYWRSGLHFAPYFSAEGSAILLAPGMHGGELPESQRKPSEWFNPSVAREDLGQPYAGQAFIERANTLDDDYRNNSPQNYLTGPGFNELDATVYKLTPIAKGSVLDIEAQIFNVYNHMNWGLPNTEGVISSGVGQPRLIQLQAKYIF